MNRFSSHLFPKIKTIKSTVSVGVCCVYVCFKTLVTKEKKKSMQKKERKQASACVKVSVLVEG